jgi:hypothetical protein
MADQLPLVVLGTAPNWTSLSQLKTGDRLAGIVNHVDFGADAVMASSSSGTVTPQSMPAGTVLANLGNGVTGVTLQALSVALGASTALGELADVNTTGVAAGDTLVYNGTTSQFEATELNLDALADVSVNTPQGGEFLAYDSVSGKWRQEADAPQDNYAYARRNGTWVVDSADAGDGGYEFTAGFAGKTAITSTLREGIDAVTTALPVVDASLFNAGGGRAIISDVEIILYSGVDLTAGANALTGVTRGALNTEAAEHLTGTTVYNAAFAWESLDGVAYTPADAAAGRWLKFGLDRSVHLASDIPYWSSPTPDPHVGIGIFGGQNMPAGVSRLIDFEGADWSTTAEPDRDGVPYTSSLNFQECRTGDLLMCRFDVEVIPQVANTTLEVGLTFVTRDPGTGAPTFEFPLTTTPQFYGTNVVGSTFLIRPFISAYFASDEDRFALALPAIKSNNPIIIRPQSMLITIIR